MQWRMLRLVRGILWYGAHAANCDIDFVFPAHDMMAVHGVITSDATAHRNTRNHLGESSPEAVDTPGNPLSNNYPGSQTCWLRNCLFVQMTYTSMPDVDWLNIRPRPAFL